MTSTVRIERDPRGVATLTLSRPEKRNALSGEMIEALSDAAVSIGSDASVRVVVMAAEGPSFCAGGDLDWMKAQRSATPEARRAEALKLAGMLRALDSMPKPLIGRIHGRAFGGGVGLVSVCDVAVGAECAEFGLTEVRLGLIPATIGPYVVARMGASRARSVFFSGRIFSAKEALSLGLLSRTVPVEELDVAVEEEVALYLDAAPGAVAEGKALLRSLGPALGDSIAEATADALVARWDNPESAEGIDSFFDKRKPSWAL